MNGSSLLIENVNGGSEDYFGDCYKFFDFPLEDIEGNVGGEDWIAKLQLLEPPSLDVMTSLSSGNFGNICNDATKVPENPPAQYDETSPKKELPSTAEAISSRRIPLHKGSDGKGLRLFQTSSPVSVLESSSSNSVENPTTFDTKIIIPVKRARSKRNRPRPYVDRQFITPFISSAPKIPHPWDAFESGSETDLTERVSNPLKRKLRKKKNLSVLSGAAEMKNDSWPEPSAGRKCNHCAVTETPQWREGPAGPKTLCNACGVRYRSGRLFPEYRPAASPTFVASLHSNCHKKVIEMRSKASVGEERASGMESSSSSPGVSNG